MNKIPALTVHGIKVPPNVKQTDRKAWVEEDRQRLLHSVYTCTAVCQWLARIEKSQIPRQAANSYTVRRYAEADIGPIATGVFIAAAIHCGFDYKFTKNGAALYFNMSERSIRQTRGFKMHFA